MSRSSQATTALAALSMAAACSLVRHVDDLYGGAAATPDSGPAACRSDCLGGACVDGVCQPVTLVSRRVSPWGVVVAEGVVYWSELGPDGQPGGVYRLGADGGATTVVQSDIAAQWIATTSGMLFWTSSVSPGAVGRCPLGGSGCLYTPGSVVQPPGSVVASGLSSRTYANNPDRVAGDATGMYWTNAGALGDTQGGSIVFCAAGGCTNPPPRILGSSLPRPRGIALDGTHVYWTNEGASATQATGSVMRVPKAGGPVETIATGQGDPAYIAVDDTNVYWTTRVTGLVMTWPKSGGAPSVLATGQGGAWDIAVDASGVYWTTWGPNGTIAMCAVPSCDGGPRVIASGLNQPYGLALDDVSVYFTELDPTKGTVMRVAKP